MNLLGSIAVEEKRYESAVQTWSDLVAEFPDSPDAKEVKGKLPLVKTLAETTTTPRTENIERQPSSEPETSQLRGVVIVGAGTEREFVDQTVSEVMTQLASQGVVVSRAPPAMSSVPEVMAKVPPNSIDSVLVLTLRFGYYENLRAECYGPDSRIRWSEKAGGSVGFTKSGIAEGLTKRILSKIAPHVGGDCLPHSASN